MASPRPPDGPRPPDRTRNGASASAPGAPPSAVVKENGRPTLKRQLHQRLLTVLPTAALQQRSEQEVRLELARLAEELTGQEPAWVDVPDLEGLIEDVLGDVLGFGPIESLMRDQEISDILINGPRQLFIEKRGQLHVSDVTFRDEAHLLQVIRRMVARTGRRLDDKSPLLDAQLPDGSRLNAVIKPPALNGPLVSIRRFGLRPLTTDDLLAYGSLAPEMLEFLAACIRARVSMVISGGTGSGKTTLLNALSRYIANSERLVSIEDTAELQLQQPHVAKMEAQPGNSKGEGSVGIRDLVKNALRMRPDRIIIGECRGAEALEMLQAMNTGHEGSLTTIHANSTRDSLSRIELMIALAGVDVPGWAVRKLVASSVNLIVQVSRVTGGQRKVVTISEIVGTEGDVVSMHNIFEYVQTGINKSQVAEGYFRATGVRPHCLHKLNVSGANLTPEMFTQRRLEVQQHREPDR